MFLYRLEQEHPNRIKCVFTDYVGYRFTIVYLGDTLLFYSLNIYFVNTWNLFRDNLHSSKNS